MSVMELVKEISTAMDGNEYTVEVFLDLQKKKKSFTLLIKAY